MTKFYSLLAAVALTATVSAQSENMGTGATGNPLVSAYAGFQNSGTWTYAGTADLRTSNASAAADYTGASGSNNVMVNAVGETFIISNINTSAISAGNVRLSFGQRKGGNAANNELTVEVSSNGTTWTPLTYTRATGTGTSIWALVTPTGTIPSTSTLSIRFTGTTTTEWRIDDVKVYDGATMAVVDATKGKANLVKNTIVANELIFGASAKVSVYNTAGQIVKTAEVSDNSRVDVSALPKGTYVVTGLVNGQTVSQKIIKK
ncbi:T9SS type A sorting domain-containing protein [Epilithonimonas sp. JDS]|uniref:T9SS type A sorting domain-containing protein n=1 Tax=Epilithonimonas sp. JDS TaxID=2902797 RepID=UPI001E340C64|nr:T9SS type A sorting domain-containing protein [Epilithonimonas sp. JDS]MCD9854923.1 T9SS type A sorting domain-containing protein [Epilithonimonas sp. JDS]